MDTKILRIKKHVKHILYKYGFGNVSKSVFKKTPEKSGQWSHELGTRIVNWAGQARSSIIRPVKSSSNLIWE